MADMLYSVIDQTAAQGWLDKRCYWCGQYFKPGDAIALVIIAFEYKKIYKNLGCNIVMHKEEFVQLEKQFNGNHEQIVTALGTHKQKRVLNVLTADQNRSIEAFRTACRLGEFTIETNNNHEIRMRNPGTSFTMSYNPRTNRVKLTDKIRKHGIFDTLYCREIEAKIYNKMQEILGSDKRDSFTVAETMQQVCNDVDKLFK